MAVDYGFYATIALVTYMLPTINVAAILLENFYPYGSKVGDNFRGRIDEGFGTTDNDLIKVYDMKYTNSQIISHAYCLF